ncbi:ABC transporter ATP-binding protein, partial [Paraburkholderia aspalathi]|nr:ABC transporter ATP-binding protein [Paraburkholderia aspalathi]
GAEASAKAAHTIGIRPEHIAVSTSQGSWPGTVTVAEHMGSDTYLHVQTDHGLINVRVDGAFTARSGDRVFLTPDQNQLHRFDSEGLALS